MDLECEATRVFELGVRGILSLGVIGILSLGREILSLGREVLSLGRELLIFSRRPTLLSPSPDFDRLGVYSGFLAMVRRDLSLSISFCVLACWVLHLSRSSRCF